MKKAIFLFITVLFIACDDGDILVEDLSFADIDVQACLPGDTSGNRTYLFYKSDVIDFESISVQVTASVDFFNVDSTVANPYLSFSLASTNQVEYRKYDGAPGDEYFCSLLPPTSPRAIDVLTSTAGEVRLIVTNQVLTSTAALNNQEDDELDSDSDGIPNYLEPLLDTDGNILDTDGDGLPNKIDEDDDGDNVLTRDEGVIIGTDGQISTARDSDIDGIPDYLDNDDDGDGIFTIQEDANRDFDPSNDFTNNTSMPDYLNPAVNVAVSPAIDSFREHQYNRIPIIEIQIPRLTLVKENGTIVFDDFEDVSNFGTFIREEYQLVLTPAFVAPE